MSMFIVPAETPGIEIIRNVANAGESDPKNGHHAHNRYNQVRIPHDHILGNPGEGFKVAQARLGGGRIHYAMRTVGKCQRAIDMMLERAALFRRQRGTAPARYCQKHTPAITRGCRNDILIGFGAAALRCP